MHSTIDYGDSTCGFDALSRRCYVTRGVGLESKGRGGCCLYLGEFTREGQQQSRSGKGDQFRENEGRVSSITRQSKRLLLPDGTAVQNKTKRPLETHCIRLFWHAIFSLKYPPPPPPPSSSHHCEYKKNDRSPPRLYHSPRTLTRSCTGVHAIPHIIRGIH